MYSNIENIMVHEYGFFAPENSIVGGLVDLSYLNGVGGSVRGVPFVQQLIRSSQTSLSDVYTGMDYGDVFNTLVAALPGSGNRLVWNDIESLLDLEPFTGLDQHFVSKGAHVYSILKEHAFVGAVQSMEQSKFDKVFGSGMSVLEELDDIINVEEKLFKLSAVESLKTEFKGILNNIIPIDMLDRQDVVNMEKLEILQLIRQFVPFLREQVFSLNNKLVSLKGLLMDKAGLDIPKKQTIGLLQYALKVAPSRGTTSDWIGAVSSKEFQDKMLLELHPVASALISEKVNIKGVLENLVSIDDAHEYLTSVVSSVSREFVTKLRAISGTLDGVTAAGLLTAASVPLAEIAPRGFVAPLMFENGVFDKDSLKSLVKGTKIIKIPEMGPLVSMTGGFLVENSNSLIASKIRTGELFKEFAFNLADGTTSGEFFIKLTKEKKVVEVLEMDEFPGGLEMFKDMITELSKVQGMFEIFSEALKLDERFKIEDFGRILASLMGKFSSVPAQA